MIPAIRREKKIKHRVAKHGYKNSYSARIMKELRVRSYL